VECSDWWMPFRADLDFKPLDQTEINTPDLEIPIRKVSDLDPSDLDPTDQIGYGF
jgi:hypothetical protein